MDPATAYRCCHSADKMRTWRVMTATVRKLVEQVQTLPPEEFGEFLSWLADYELEHSDAWDKEIERDSLPGGRLEGVMKQAQEAITSGKTKPLDEIIDNT